jgi:hypothetical protein
MRLTLAALLVATVAHADLTPQAQKVQQSLQEIIRMNRDKGGNDEQFLIRPESPPSAAIEDIYPSLGGLKNISDWTDIIAHLPEVAPSDPAKALLFNSILDLPPDVYLSVIDQVIDSYKRRPFLDELLYAVVFPPWGKNRDILSYNYREPRVKAIIEKLRPIEFKGPGNSPAEMSKFYDEILSGEDVEERETYRLANAGDFPHWIAPIATAAPSGGQLGARTDEHLLETPEDSKVIGKVTSRGVVCVGVATSLAIAASALALMLKGRKR